MRKDFNKYQIEVDASVNSSTSAQILFYKEKHFVGRIDFIENGSLPDSYLWHPNGSNDPEQIYIVLYMPIERFAVVTELIRTEGPWFIQLWPGGDMSGASTPGYGGVLATATGEPIGEEERALLKGKLL